MSREQASREDILLLIEASWCARHLARQVENVSSAIGYIAGTSNAMSQFALDAHLDGQYRLMNALGDILNGMDAADEEDSRWDELFEKLHERFRVEPQG